jgi:hypothetical protein
MSAATMLNANDPAFNFEHRMIHTTMLIASGPGVNFFSSVPYWIDPSYGDTAIPAGWANSLHAQAHADFIGLFPALYGGSGLSALNDISLYDERGSWWQFSNFQLHYTAAQAPS